MTYPKKKKNLTKRREFNRKRAERSTTDPRKPVDAELTRLSPGNWDSAHHEQSTAPVTPAETRTRRERQDYSDDDSETSNDDLDHQTSDEDRSTTERDTEEQPDVASTGPMSEGAKNNGEDKCDHIGSEGDSDTKDTADDEYPWDDSESDKEENDIELALSITSNKTADITPNSTTGDDMDVENDNIISTSTEDEIAGRLQIMQEKCREASTIRRTGKPLNNMNRSDDDEAETDNGFQTVMSTQDSRATHKKKAKKVSHKKRLGSLQHIDLTTHERIRLTLSFNTAHLAAGKVISSLWHKIDSNARLTVVTGEFKATPSESYM
jgi:hypothetical protein